MSDLAAVQKKILDFRNARDWAQFHDPKNLAEALSIEAGELLENFLWKTTEQSRNLSAEELARPDNHVKGTSSRVARKDSEWRDEQIMKFFTKCSKIF
jgi:hypothetical protein